MIWKFDPIFDLKSSAAIHNLLFEKGIRGNVGCNRYCVVANYFRHKYGPLNIIVEPECIIINEERKLNTQALGSFIDDFDDGCYRDLEI